MKLLSVNVAMPRTVLSGDTPVTTGIFKEPLRGRAAVTTLGIAGDGQADLKHHGGIYKAVYSYPFEHYDFWSRELDRTDFTFGQFGENLTVEGLLEDEVNIGDMFRIGDVMLEVTQPRVPCYKLALKMQRTDFIKMFAASGRVGFYQRVLSEGNIGAGDDIVRVKIDPRGVTVREMMDLMYFEKGDADLLERAIAIPALTPSWRDDLKARLHGQELVGKE